MSDLLRDARTKQLLSLLRRAENREAGIPIADLPEHLRDEGLLCQWLAADLVEVVRRNHCHVGGGPHCKLVLEPGWSIAELSKPNRKRVWQLLKEALAEGVEAEIRLCLRLGKAGDVEAARLVPASAADILERIGELRHRWLEPSDIGFYSPQEVVDELWSDMLLLGWSPPRCPKLPGWTFVELTDKGSGEKVRECWRTFHEAMSLAEQAAAGHAGSVGAGNNADLAEQLDEKWRDLVPELARLDFAYRHARHLLLDAISPIEEREQVLAKLTTFPALQESWSRTIRECAPITHVKNLCVLCRTIRPYLNVIAGCEHHYPPFLLGGNGERYDGTGLVRELWDAMHRVVAGTCRPTMPTAVPDATATMAAVDQAIAWCEANGGALEAVKTPPETAQGSGQGTADAITPEDSPNAADAIDETAYRPAAELWKGRFKDYKTFKRFLDKHPSIQSKQKGQRRFVHAGDLTRVLAEQDRKAFDALDAPPETVSAFLAEAAERQSQILAGKAKRK